uniref:thiamin pyrophosphokinase 1-like n=1 Tax=Ciona intestinalis TaxID=7719 RepID=UPI000180CAD0|nr:thiamin pyrophosphokinase 1-like [Ciona intestinalis]|eukprot:XP_002130370.1 thiamin pyrophosphokinase 1-like [Ciona intestinalis]
MSCNSQTEVTLSFTPLGFMDTKKYNKKIAIVVVKDHGSAGCSTKLDFLKELWKHACYRTIVNLDTKPSSCNWLKKLETGSFLYFNDGKFDSLSIEANSTMLSAQKTDTEGITNLNLCLDHIVSVINMKKCAATEILIVSTGVRTTTDVIEYLRIMYSAQNAAKIALPISVVVSESFISVLPKGSSNLAVGTGFEGKWCGLLPFGGEIVATTKGLKWNLTENILQYNQLISTSNELDGSGIVLIKSNLPVVWTQGIKF